MAHFHPGGWICSCGLTACVCKPVPISDPRRERAVEEADRLPPVYCPQCGFVQTRDEDHCCHTCGATVVDTARLLLDLARARALAAAPGVGFETVFRGVPVFHTEPLSATAERPAGSALAEVQVSPQGGASSVAVGLDACGPRVPERPAASVGEPGGVAKIVGIDGPFLQRGEDVVRPLTDAELNMIRVFTKDEDAAPIFASTARALIATIDAARTGPTPTPEERALAEAGELLGEALPVVRAQRSLYRSMYPLWDLDERIDAFLSRAKASEGGGAKPSQPGVPTP